MKKLVNLRYVLFFCFCFFFYVLFSVFCAFFFLAKARKRRVVRVQLFEGRLALNPGFFFCCSKAFSQIIFSVIFRASNRQLVHKKN